MSSPSTKPSGSIPPMRRPLRVAFVNPPFLPDYSRGQRSPAVTRSGTLYYPMWLAAAAAHAIRLGHEVELIDAVAIGKNHDETIARLQAFAPHLVLVEAATPSIENDLAFAARAKEACAPASVFMCGTHVSALPEESLALQPSLDGALIGELEIPLEEIMECLAEGRAVYGGEGVHLPGRPAAPRNRYFENLDARPFLSEIYHRFLPISRYFNPNAHHPMVSILSGRGCPFRCTFCVFPQTLTGHGYRKRSVDSLIDEFRWISEHMPHVRGVFIEDDTFTADRKRVDEFCRKLRDLRLPLSWTVNARADVDLETLRAMKGAGLRGVCVGFESGSQELLDRIHKGTNIAAMERFAADARTAGIKVHGCFMVGLPGETRVTLQQTLQFALRLPLDTAQFYPLMVYPGTEAYDWAKANGMLTAERWRDWLSPEGLHQCVVRSADLTSAHLVRFCNHARRKFYLRRSYLLATAWRVLTDAEERHRVVRSARTFLRHLFLDR
ncbi:MAG: coproporphyrinogen III oxidase [bacterium ADurb.Bin374]|nr:MAG: coproporphyrinogen III oxidase [bacterium ADurb.Bin374]